jgi:hypothetical protein
VSLSGKTAAATARVVEVRVYALVLRERGGGERERRERERERERQRERVCIYENSIYHSFLLSLSRALSHSLAGRE